MNNDWSDIRVFVAVIDQGSFSRAGIHLGKSKSAVSKKIGQLESRLGVQLLRRTTRQLSLTEAGEQFWEYAQRALALIQEGEDSVTRLQGAPQGQLRINTPMSFGHLHIAPIIPQFLIENPKIDIDMHMNDRFIDLVEGNFDVGIRIGNLKDSSLVARRLTTCRRVICASPRYLEKHGTPQIPKDLANHNCMFYSYFQGGAEWSLLGPEGPTNVPPHGQYQVNNSEALREALLADLGIAHIPTFVVGPDIAAGQLIPILKDFRPPDLNIYAVFPERRYLPAKVRSILDFMVDQFGGEVPYWDRNTGLV